MEPHVVGSVAQSKFSAAVYLVAVYHSQSPGLCRSSSAIPLLSDALHLVWRSTPGRKDFGDRVRQRGSILMLLAVGALPGSLLAPVAAGAAGLLSAFSLPAKHGQGPTVRHYLSGNCDTFS